ncbi:phage tail tape measure protein [Shinella granuli]|uniref:TP901 family phage tail tape measure protein n=1 Tax=Shinella granuli TaxID=323621 RepID=A0A4R2D3L4_SHIGR|nr:phage tail tape measure protein [Shinella granuli]TCN48887.1 TP901 family phage tail tape measure protein [Shinella granuli]
MSDITSRLIVGLVDRLTGPSRAISSAVGRLNAAAAANAARMNAARGAMVDAAGMGYVLAQSLTAPIKAAINFESSMSDIAKVVNFESPAAFKQMGLDIRKMSMEIPVAADGLAQIVAAAGQSGIATNELMKFTEMAAKVGVAWDISAGDAGQAMAELKTALGRSLKDTGLLADAINHLGNNSAASAPQILDVVRSVAPSASQFGMTAEHVAALGAAMTGAGFGADVAATSILNVGRALTKGASATPKTNKAFKSIGLNAKAVAKSMQVDAMGTLQDVLKRINKLPSALRASTISEIFGNEARALAPLISNGNLLADTLALVSDEAKYAGSANAEFAIASKRTANAIQGFKNRVNDLAISVGDALLPALNGILDKIGPIVTDISDLARRFPVATQAIVGITSAFIALRIAVTALRFAGLFAFGSVLSAGIGALGGASAILTGVSSGLTALGAAVATVSAPALLAIGAGLAVIGGAGTYLWAKWDRISSIVTGVARALGDELKPVIDLLQPVLDHFAPSFEAIGDGAKWAWEQVKELSSWLGSIFAKEDLTRQHEMVVEDNAFAVTKKIVAAFKEGGKALFDAGAEMIQSLWDGMVSKVEAMIEWVKTIPARIRDNITTDLTGTIKGLLGYGDSSEPSGGSTTTTTSSEPVISGHRARGGPVKAGHTYEVNEKGRELFTPGRSGVISTNEAYNAAAAGSAAARGGQARAGSKTVTISPTISPTINIHTQATGSDPQALARDISDKVGDYLIGRLEGACGFALEDGTYT